MDYSSESHVLGILSIVFAIISLFISPLALVGLILGIIGFRMAGKQSTDISKKAKKLNKIGIIISIIALIVIITIMVLTYLGYIPSTGTLS